MVEFNFQAADGKILLLYVFNEFIDDTVDEPVAVVYGFYNVVRLESPVEILFSFLFNVSYSPVDAEKDFLLFHRLQDIVKHTVSDSFNGVIKFLIPGNENNAWTKVFPFYFNKKIYAVHFRHVDIGKTDINFFTAQNLQSL